MSRVHPADLPAHPDTPEPIRRLEALARIRDLPLGAGQLRWRGFGEGPPLVLLHGGHGNWLHWARNIDALALRHAVWVADMPGYGDSAEPVEPAAMGSLVEGMAQSIEALLGADQPFDLAGFSFGGLVAAHLAAGRLAVRRLILLGPAGHAGARRPKGEMLAWRRALADPDPQALTAVMRHNLAMQMLHQPEAIDPLALAVHTRACLATRFRSREISRGGGLPQLLAQCRAPLRLLWGEHDVTCDPVRLSESLGAQASDRQARVLPGVGHWVQYEAAEAVNRQLRAWLDEPAG
ncbi:MAG: alpha/beta fold hydrolase [Betaproteobacteria bacterium]|nr:alpha/beta fold hydrolase [Betaproteobacteria bacterium]